MSRAFQRRVVLGLALLGAAALGTFAAARWEDIVIAWWAHALRREPDRLEEMLLAGGSKERAAREFVREPAGRKALFCLYLAEFDKAQPGFSNREYLERIVNTEVTHGSLTLWAGGYSCQSTSGTSGGTSVSLASVPLDPHRREAILGLLDACVGEVFRVPEHPRLEFQVRPVSGGVVESPPWPDSGPVEVRPSPVTPPGARFVCFFRVLPKERR